MAECILMQAGGGGLDPDELTATAGDVLKGMLAGVKGYDDPVMGTLELTGTAADSQVLNGQTYYNTDAKTKRTGGMPNRGAWNSRIGVNGRVTIPAGYHNGAGYVDQSITNRGAWTSSVAMNGRVTVPEGYHSGGGYVSGPAVTQRGAWATSIGVNGIAYIPEGYHNGSGYVNQSIATSGGWTITPQTTAQSCGIAGHYMASDMTVAGVALPPANAIKKGYRYWIGNNYVDGTFEGYASSPLYLYKNGTWSNLQTTGISMLRGQLSYGATYPSVTLVLGNRPIGRLNQTVNMAGYNYLKVKCSLKNGMGPFWIGVSTSSSMTDLNGLVSKSSVANINETVVAVSDVSSLSGGYYIYFYTDMGGTVITVTEIYLSST